MIEKNNALLENARLLRRDMTPHERKLWYCFLRNYPIKVFIQRIIESYIVDFYCPKAGLVIEVDGSQHYEPKEMLYDERRTKVLEKYHLLVLRFSNREIDRAFRNVCESINQVITERLEYNPYEMMKEEK